MGIIAWLHIGSGALAVAAGFVAVAVRKGARWHRLSGKVFVAAMLASSLLGAGLGAWLYQTQWITFHAGVLAAYLVLSGWFAASRDRSQATTARAALAFVNFSNVIALAGFAIAAANNADGLFLRYPAEDYAVLATMAGIAAVADFRLVFGGAVLLQHRRIARHLWRMCLGFFIAAGSAFTGPGASAFPRAWQESGWLALPELAILVTMLFWLTRTWWLRRQAQTTDAG